MNHKKSVFDLFDHDDNFKFLMKRMLESYIEESFESIIITEAGKGYPIVYVNPAFTEMTGYESEDVLGKSPSLLQGEKTDPKVIQQLDDDIKAGRLFHGRALNYRKDGTTFTMEWKIVPIRGKDDEVSHYIAMQRDVSDHPQ